MTTISLGSALALLSAFIAFPAYGKLEPGTVIQNVYLSDGDSGRLDGHKFRLDDIDAPETFKPKCEQERVLGFEAKEWALGYVRGKQLVVTRNEGQDRYERYIIRLSVDGVDLGEAGMQAGVYGSWKHDGTRALEEKPDWCSD